MDPIYNSPTIWRATTITKRTSIRLKLQLKLAILERAGEDKKKKNHTSNKEKH